jgi:hypothetical protein
MGQMYNDMWSNWSELELEYVERETSNYLGEKLYILVLAGNDLLWRKWLMKWRITQRMSCTRDALYK